MLALTCRLFARSLSHFSPVVAATTASFVDSITVAAGVPRQTGFVGWLSDSVVRSAAGASARTAARLPPAKIGIEKDACSLRPSVSLMGAHSRSILPL